MVKMERFQGRWDPPYVQFCFMCRGQRFHTLREHVYITQAEEEER